MVFDLTGQGRTVVRGGYALAYSFINAQFHLNTSVAQPWGAEIRLPPTNFDDPFAGTGIDNFFPFVLGKDSPFAPFGPYIAIPPDIKTPRQQSWNATFEQQIGGNMAAQASYIGSYSDRQWNVRSLNPGEYIPGSCTLETLTGPRFFPVCTNPGNLDLRRTITRLNFETGRFLGAVDEHTAFGEQRYHGLRLGFQRRSATGVALNGNYTVSKCEGHPTTSLPNVGTGWSDPNDPDRDFGACDSDRRHIMNLTASIETPRFENTALRALASAWRVSGIVRATSGASAYRTDPRALMIGASPSR